MRQPHTLRTGMALAVAGFMIPYPVVLAQPLEVADVDTTRAAVETQVERLVTELALRDPELAQEIERQGEVCLRDLSDGQLESPEFTKEVETYRDVQRELAERVVQDALARDPEGAQRMKEMFEAAERGELVRPTPEMMERMHQEMGDYLRENPEMRDYAAAEWDRMMEHGVDSGERFGPTDTPEQAREAFERWSTESGASQADVDRMRAEMERGFEMGMHEMERGMDMAHEFEAHAREYEAAERDFREAMEREYGGVLDSKAEFFADMQSGGTPPSESPHALVGDLPGPTEQWVGPSGSHEHPDGTAPHTAP